MREADNLQAKSKGGMPMLKQVLTADMTKRSVLSTMIPRDTSSNSSLDSGKQYRTEDLHCHPLTLWYKGYFQALG